MAKERENKRSDRLSSLPDELICHILSFLPRTKPSVQTSVLSKKWRFLWTRVPFLGFDYDDTCRADIITKIVSQQHKHGIHAFSIAIADRDDEIEEEFHSWIVNITTTRNIRRLVIVFQGFGGGLKLPQCLFTCRTVVDLWLDACGDIPVSGIYFPALKKLKLCHFQFKYNKSLAHLISGCPVLEELIIKGVKLGGHCCISSPTLTKLLSLEIDNISVINESAFFASGIKFHNLTRLYLSAHLGFIPFFLGNANNLRVLEFRVFVSKEDDEGYGWKEPEQVPACLLSHLQTFELDLSWLHGRSFKHVYDMVRYILVNAKVLKRMKVPKRWIHKKKLKTFKRVVALFERGSQECELIFSTNHG